MSKPKSLLFVIPLKSKGNSKDWAQTSRSLEATLSCIEGQTSSAFHALVVCNELPLLSREYPSITFMQTDIRIDGKFSFEKARLDKQRKVLYGLLSARELNPDRAMVLDSDDLIHKDLVDYAAGRPAEGLVINRGYRYQLSKPKLRKSRNYHMISGSSMIFPYRSADFPGSLEYEDVEHHFMSRMAHPKPIEKIFSDNGVSFENVPFYAGVYVRGHNDSIRDHFRPSSKQNAVVTLNTGKLGARLTSRAWKIYGRLIGTRKIDGDLKDQFPGLKVYTDRAANAY